MEIGQYLIKARKNKSLSQEDVASSLNVSRQSVSLWECDQTIPSLDNLIALSKLYDVSIAVLTGQEKFVVEIKQEDLQNGTTVTWKVPIENTMLDMGSNEYITDTENNLPIGIKNTYDNNLSNNDIYLIMQYKDQTFITKTNFTFSKQGQNGTNGTKYQFKLKVKDNKEPVITYKNGQWEPESLIVEPELWNNGIFEFSIF